ARGWLVHRAPGEIGEICCRRNPIDRADRRLPGSRGHLSRGLCGASFRSRIPGWSAGNRFPARAHRGIAADAQAFRCPMRAAETEEGAGDMRFVIAVMKHETNTFSPVPTPLARFGTGEGPLFGKAAYQALRGSSSAIGAFIDLAEAEGAEILTPVAADAPPSGPVEDAAYRAMSDAICEAVRGGCDAGLLDLHGAMVTQSLEDGEGALLSRIRGIAPGIPIAVALDMHANVHAAMVDNADVIAGYQTYPHIDIRDTGERAGRALIGMLKGKARPTMAWGQRPM